MSSQESIKMFVWRSKALKNYGDGYIIILAENVESARASARTKFVPYIKARWEWCLPEYCGGDTEYYDEKLAELEADINNEPQTLGSLFISGSE